MPFMSNDLQFQFTMRNINCHNVFSMIDEIILNVSKDNDEYGPYQTYLGIRLIHNIIHRYIEKFHIYEHISEFRIKLNILYRELVTNAEYCHVHVTFIKMIDMIDADLDDAEIFQCQGKLEKTMINVSHERCLNNQLRKFHEDEMRSKYNHTLWKKFMDDTKNLPYNTNKSKNASGDDDTLKSNYDKDVIIKYFECLKYMYCHSLPMNIDSKVDYDVVVDMIKKTGGLVQYVTKHKEILGIFPNSFFKYYNEHFIKEVMSLCKPLQNPKDRDSMKSMMEIYIALLETDNLMNEYHMKIIDILLARTNSYSAYLKDKFIYASCLMSKSKETLAFSKYHDIQLSEENYHQILINDPMSIFDLPDDIKTNEELISKFLLHPFSNTYKPNPQTIIKYGFKSNYDMSNPRLSYLEIKDPDYMRSIGKETDVLDETMRDTIKQSAISIKPKNKKEMVFQ